MTTSKQGDNPILDALKALEARIEAKFDDQNRQIANMRGQQGEIHEAIVGSLDGARRGLLRRVEQLEYIVGGVVSIAVVVGGIIAAYIKNFISGGRA